MRRMKPVSSISNAVILRILALSCIAVIQTNVSGFTEYVRWGNHNVRRRVGFALNSATQPINNVESDSITWMKRGMLISSFHDGVLNNPLAQEFLKSSILEAIWDDHRQCIEQLVCDSAIQSPCCGPNMAALEALEQMDQDVKVGQLPKDSELRFVYIPTAMYAIRSDSQNTPGRQRQRARADAKQRRNTIVQFLQDQLGNCVNVLSVTLDLDDGSIKQPEGSIAGMFPKNGMEALQQWAPHLIYVEGGNTFWLHYCMQKDEWGPRLTEACQRAVYVGKSAGAILAGYSVETACWKGWDDPSIVPGMSAYSNWKGIRGLGLVGELSFFPHMAQEWEERVASLGNELDKSYAVCCLTDEQVCCVDGVAKRIQVLSAQASETVIEDAISSRHLAGSRAVELHSEL